jgi:hypothetical protein
MSSSDTTNTYFSKQNGREKRTRRSGPPKKFYHRNEIKDASNNRNGVCFKTLVRKFPRGGWGGGGHRITNVSPVLWSSYSEPSGPGSIVGIATGYGLDGPGIESRLGRDFPHLSRPALVPTQPPIQWVPGLSRGLRAAGV